MASNLVSSQDRAVSSSAADLKLRASRASESPRADSWTWPDQTREVIPAAGITPLSFCPPIPPCKASSSLSRVTLVRKSESLTPQQDSPFITGLREKKTEIPRGLSISFQSGTGGKKPTPFSPPDRHSAPHRPHVATTFMVVGNKFPFGASAVCLRHWSRVVALTAVRIGFVKKK